jgi:ABC-2 type transport system permease protein
MWQRIREIVRKEFRQALREPRMRAMLFVPPLIQLLIFGYAVNLDVEKARIAWMDQDHTPESRELLAGYLGAPRIKVVAWPGSEEEVRDLLDRGTVHAVVRVLPNFARDIRRGNTGVVQILVDGSNSNTASIVAGYAGNVVAAYATRVQALRLRQKQVAATFAAGTPVNPGLPRLDTRTRVWFNPDLLSRNYFVPGVVVNIITLVTLMLTAMAIVREKEIGTMEQLMVTPIRPIELMIGKTLPFAVVGLVDLIVITAASLVVFHVPLRGNLLVLLLSAILFLMTTLGVGLFISTISNTQQQALMASFFFFNPAFMLSGFAFPIRNMPDPVQYFTYLNPVRYFMEIVRAVFLKGAGFATLWPQMAALAVFGVTILSLSALRFHKRLD